jgi:hypothetical protein
MIHLRKYNESKEDIDPVDSEYIKNCFIEFLDTPNNEITNNFRNFCYINLKEPKINRAYNIDGTFVIEEYIESLQKHTEFYLDVDNCINKVKLEYPNYKCNSSLSNDMGGTTLKLRFYNNKNN